MKINFGKAIDKLLI